MKIKLCGFTDPEALAVAIAQKCDFLGFVFYEKSPRFVTPNQASALSYSIPKNISKVAVTVDPPINLLQEISDKFHPDFFQFHGSETASFLNEVKQKFPKIKIIKAFKIALIQDLDSVKIFENCADCFLFDAKIKGEIGGSGKNFDWKILQNFISKKEWFLSGGLNIDNIEEAIKITGAKMIDISSGIEEIRGRKSPKLIKEFMEKVRDLCH